MTLCGWCTRPGRTRIYLRSSVRSDEDSWCCVAHQNDALELADAYQSWVHILRLRNLIASSCFRGSTINVTMARAELDKLELAFWSTVGG